MASPLQALVMHGLVKFDVLFIEFIWKFSQRLKPFHVGSGRKGLMIEVSYFCGYVVFANSHIQKDITRIDEFGPVIFGETGHIEN